jgi:hypothetical protein
VYSQIKTTLVYAARQEMHGVRWMGDVVADQEVREGNCEHNNNRRRQPLS